MPVVNAAVQPAGVHAAIARASAATGVDFDYLLAQARIESGLDADAQATTSSASGLYQFISGTWLETLGRHGGAHGMGWAQAAIEQRGGRFHIDDPAMRTQVMALRNDPQVAALMAAELARDNAGTLRGTLGREPDAAELYLAHFLGAAGADRFLRALQTAPEQQAATLFPQAATANRAIFFEGGRPRSTGEMMDLLRSKIAGAMAQGGGGPTRTEGVPLRSAPLPIVRAVLAPEQSPEPPKSRPSMAETLRATFAADAPLHSHADARFAERSDERAGNRADNWAGNWSGAHLPGRAGRQIDAAYARFRSLGL